MRHSGTYTKRQARQCKLILFNGFPFRINVISDKNEFWVKTRFWLIIYQHRIYYRRYTLNKELSIKLSAVRGEGPGLSRADKEVRFFRWDVRTFWCKNLGFFEIYGVSARTRGLRWSSADILWTRGRRWIFRDFMQTYFMNGP